MSYLKNILTTGAISRTPNKVIESINNELKFVKASIVIELGAGKGEITKYILSKYVSNEPRYYAIELNPEFASELKLKFPNINVIQTNALIFDQLISECSDLIICSLPLSFFSNKDLNILLTKIKQKTAMQGTGIILFHAFWLIPKLKNCFKNYKIIRIRNIPCYYIFIFKSVL